MKKRRTYGSSCSVIRLSVILRFLLWIEWIPRRRRSSQGRLCNIFLLIFRRLGPRLQLSRREHGVESHTQEVDHGRNDENCLPLFRFLIQWANVHFNRSSLHKNSKNWCILRFWWAIRPQWGKTFPTECRRRWRCPSGCWRSAEQCPGDWRWNLRDRMSSFKMEC